MPASVQTHGSWNTDCGYLEEIVERSVRQLNREGPDKDGKLWSEILGAINALAVMVETSKGRTADHKAAKKSLAAAFAEVEGSWSLECGRLEGVVQQIREGKGEDKAKLWSSAISAIDALAGMVGASKGRSPTRHEAARASLVSALADVCGEMERVTSQSKPTEADQFRKTLIAAGNDDILYIIIMTLKAWRMAETSRNSEDKEEASRGFAARVRLEPGENQAELAGEYEKVYAETLEVSKRIQVECTRIEAEAASKIAPLKDELEQAAIRLEPYFDAKVRERLAQMKPTTLPERTSFAEWIMGEVRGLGYHLYDADKRKPARLVVVAGRLDWRLIPAGATSGKTREKLTDFLPFEVTAGGNRKIMQNMSLRQIESGEQDLV
jgi:hypothetical protein